MTTDVNQFDLVFTVDTTGSMGVFISAAHTLMINMVKSLSANAEVDMKVGIVEYRDHKPQDTVLVVNHQLGSFEAAQKEILKLGATGGGDGPEAVLDGVLEACKEIKWRKHSRRVVVLIGDAPPHGVGCAGDGFPKGCPCGETIESVTAAAEEKGITLHAVSLGNEAKKSFSLLAQLTGGELFAADSGSAMEKIQGILKEEFGNLDLDHKVLEAWNDEATVDSVAKSLEAKPSEITASYMRLCRRGLIDDKVSVAV